MARFTGAGDRKAAIHVTNQSLLLAVVLGLTRHVVGLAVAGHGPRLAPTSRRRRRGMPPTICGRWFCCWSFQVIELAGIACLVGAGDTRHRPVGAGRCRLVNVPLAWLFFHGGRRCRASAFPGIALGTALSHMLGAVAVLAVLARGRAGLRPRPAPAAGRTRT